MKTKATTTATLCSSRPPPLYAPHSIPKRHIHHTHTHTTHSCTTRIKATTTAT